MDKDLKERIKVCEAQIASMQQKINVATTILKSRVELLGKSRECIIKHVREDFRSIWENFGKNLKLKEYDIPTDAISSISVNVDAFTSPTFSNFQNIAPLIKDSVYLAHKAIQTYGTFKGKVVPGPVNDSGIWWLNLLTHAANYISEKARQREEEETAVREYESKVRISLAQSERKCTEIDGITQRIHELMISLQGLAMRFDQLYEKILKILPKFDTSNNDHICLYNEIETIFKAILDYYKIEIVDKNQELSEFDKNLIIRTKKLLA